MDEQSKAQLDAILAKEPAALTDSEKEFLRARSSYLTISQREVFAEVLSELTPEERLENEVSDETRFPDEASSEDTAPTVKRGRKKASVTE